MYKHRQADMKITSSSVCVHQTCITRDRRVPSEVIDFACICANQYLRQWVQRLHLIYRREKEREKED